MILCINPNAAIDKTVVVPSFHLNEIHRPQQVMAIPGGKGCNVARALLRLGDEPVVSGWVGGYAGQFIEDGLRREGIASSFVHTDFESRTCLSIVDPENGTLTELYEKGETVPTDKVEAFKAHFSAILGGGRYQAVTLSGSLPPGVPPTFYADLITLAHGANVSALLDTSGEALRQSLPACPMLIKPNAREFSDLLGKPLTGVAEYAIAVREVSARYRTRIVLSLGADGALVSDDEGRALLHACPPAIAHKSAVGSGDCLLAGVAYGLTHGFSLEDAIRHGVAAGTANAMTLGAGVFTTEDFEQVRAAIRIEAV